MWEEGKASSKSPSQARSPWPVRSELGFSCPRVFFERKDKVYLEPGSPWSPPKPLSFKNAIYKKKKMPFIGGSSRTIG